MAKKKGMTATEAADKLTKAFKLSPPLPARWSAIFRAAEELGHSARVMINANEGALVQSERLGFSNGGGSIFDPANKYPNIKSLEDAKKFLDSSEGQKILQSGQMVGYGNVLSLDDLSNAFATGGDAPGNKYLREASKINTVS